MIAVLAAGPAPGQEVFEVPIELELPDAPLVLDLDNASLEVVLDAEAVPVLRALGGSDNDSSGTALAVSDNGTIVVRRAGSQGEPPDGAPAGAPGDVPRPRLRLELVFDPERRLDILGSDLTVAIEGPPVVEIEGEEDEDEDEDEEDEDEDEDDEGEDEEDESEGEDEDEAPAPVEPVIAHHLFLEIAGSSVNLIGVEGASVTAIESYVHASGTHGMLALALEGGTVEIEGHQGAIGFTGRDGEVTLTDTLGQGTIALTGGSLLVRGGSGQLDGTLDEALLRLDGWRGSMVVAGSGARVEARALPGTRMEIKGAGHEVAIEDLQGSIVADLSGGSLTASQLRGQAQIKARNGADVAIQGFEGRPHLDLDDSSAHVVDVRGQLTAAIRGGRLEIDGVQRLDLVATDAEIVAGRLESLTKAEITDSQLDLDLSELRHDPGLTLRGSTDARVRLSTPCSVKLAEARLLRGGTDVTGCDLHSQTVRRRSFESRSLDGRRRVTLNVTLGDRSTLEVEGVP